MEGLLDLPIRWIKPRRIFVNSMSDLFHESVPFQFIADVFAVMQCTTRHTYQILTKRPERMLEFFRWLEIEPWSGQPRQVDPLRVWPEWTAARNGRGGYDNCGPDWPCENVWLGVSVEDQMRADERIPLLLQTPAAKRFVSYEPALGPVEFMREYGERDAWDWLRGNRLSADAGDAAGIGRGRFVEPTAGLDWIIIGGESGPKARTFEIAWARSTIDQCKAAGVPAFVKQMGSRAYVANPSSRHNLPLRYLPKYSDDESGQAWIAFNDRAGADPEEWPEDLRVREFPAP